MAVKLWRCAACGKWSHARRRPFKHKRWHQHDEQERWRGWFLWCGPFEEWTATMTDPAPIYPDHPVGTVVSQSEKEAAMECRERVEF